MDARELRIGNVCRYTDDCRVKEHLRNNPFTIIADDILFLSENSNVDYVKPVVLTHEILLSLGFEIFPWGYVIKSSNDFGIRLNLKSFVYEVSGNSAVKIIYLHQLQNLYFALTGEELPINL